MFRIIDIYLVMARCEVEITGWLSSPIIDGPRPVLVLNEEIHTNQSGLNRRLQRMLTTYFSSCYKISSNPRDWLPTRR